MSSPVKAIVGEQMPSLEFSCSIHFCSQLVRRGHAIQIQMANICADYFVGFRTWVVNTNLLPLRHKFRTAIKLS